MKKIAFALLTVIASSVVLTSCKSSQPAPAPAPAPMGSYSSGK